MMEREISEEVEVCAESYFLKEHSSPEEHHYVYAYKIRISNLGSRTVQLLTRHWIITDSNGEVSEVRGDGVVGEQPVLDPGEDFEYASRRHLKTGMGTIQGSYEMIGEKGESLDVSTPCFTQSVPGMVN